MELQERLSGFGQPFLFTLPNKKRPACTMQTGRFIHVLQPTPVPFCGNARPVRELLGCCNHKSLYLFYRQDVRQ
jgi:hypothetical protein